jgi:hypothetical protein
MGMKTVMQRTRSTRSNTCRMTEEEEEEDGATAGDTAELLSDI